MISYADLGVSCCQYKTCLLCIPMDFVLKDPRLKDRDATSKKSAAMMELDVVPKPWAKSYWQSMGAISRSLHLTNPIIRQVLHSWYKNYSSLRLIKSSALLAFNDVMELSLFQGIIVRNVEEAKNVLLKK